MTACIGRYCHKPASQQEVKTIYFFFTIFMHSLQSRNGHFIRSCLSIRDLVSAPKPFDKVFKIQYGRLSLKVARQFQFCLKLDKNNTEFISTSTRISAHILSVTLNIYKSACWNNFMPHIFFCITLLDSEIIKQRNSFLFFFCSHISKSVNHSTDLDEI
jgi:hypothetical protein